MVDRYVIGSIDSSDIEDEINKEEMKSVENKRLVIIGGGESGVGAAILAKSLLFSISLSFFIYFANTT